MRWYEDKRIEDFDWKQFVNENKEHFPLIYNACQKSGYFLNYSYPIIVRIYKDQEFKHPTGIAIYEFKTKKPEHIHIYALEVYDQERLHGNGRQLLNSFYETADRISLSCLPEVRIFYEKQGFQEQGECRMMWHKGETRNV